MLPVSVRLSVRNRGISPCSSVRKGDVSLLYGSSQSSPGGAHSGIVKASDPSVSLDSFLFLEYAVYTKIKERLQMGSFFRGFRDKHMLEFMCALLRGGCIIMVPRDSFHDRRS